MKSTLNMEIINRPLCKKDLCFLIANPNCNLLSKKDKTTGEPVKPIDNRTLKRKLEPYFAELNIKGLAHYRAISKFTPAQVRLIYEVLL